ARIPGGLRGRCARPAEADRSRGHRGRGEPQHVRDGTSLLLLQGVLGPADAAARGAAHERRALRGVLQRRLPGSAPAPRARVRGRRRGEAAMSPGRAGLRALLAAGCLAASGCGLFGSKPPTPPPPLVYSLCLDASPRLNWYNDTANTLYVRAYQLSTADTFMQTDPARMVEAGFTPAGAEGAPPQKTIFPRTKTTGDIL